MKLVKVGEGNPYEAAHHYKYWAMNKISPDSVSKRLNIGVSHFLPGGGAEYSSSPLERVYFCIEGTITVKGKNNDEYKLESGDMIYIAPGEERMFTVPNTKPATILVIMAKVA
jgi:quercetin dioxygenase-like cupin family protein